MMTAFILLLCLISGVIGDIIVTFNLQEGIPTSTLVGSIANESRLRQNMSKGEFESLQFNFLDQTKMQTLFSIDTGNGNLRTAVVIDRETECGFRESCYLKFDVMAHSLTTSNFVIISVEILLEDINDNSPIFNPNFVTLTVSESAAVGTTLGVEDANDADTTSQNQIVSYQILPLDGVFGLNATKKSDGSFILKLVLKQKLDRESQTRYPIQVVAKDGGLQPNSGILNVDIQVLDDNDNSPEFEHKLYNVTINEDVSVGTSLVKVSASDSDSGENAQIIYRFNSRQTALNMITEMFEINSATGIIRVKNKLRYDLDKDFDILVEASDKGKQPLTDQTVVRVKILDVKNNPPVVRINFLSSGNSTVVNVSEGINTGAVIAHVNVDDSDSGNNGNVTCLTSDERFRLRVVQGKGYIMVINKPLDREVQSVLNVSIICSDQGTPSLSTTVQFMVRVMDKNDQTPEFSQSVYIASITENNAVGDVVTQISAHDFDFGQNAVIRYHLHQNSQNKFAINPNTGVITANVLFDRETVATYKFSVLATDNGSPPLTGSASVIVTVTDLNDNAPFFDEPMFQFFFMENQSRDITIGTLIARDPDDGQNSKVLFKLDGIATPDFPFYILQDGSIKTVRGLDREVQSSYDFSVMAYDLGVPSRNNTTRVMVYVTDANDEAPSIRFPNRVNNSMSISYMAPVGSLISKVDAVDRDEQGKNSQLTYELTKGNELEIFTIGKTTGKIFLTKTYNIKADMTFMVRVTVRDRGDIPLESFQDFHIILKFTNESSLQPLKDNGNRNIIISAVLVALTFVISAVIVTVICIIRRNDEKTVRNNENHEKLYSAAPSHIVAVETKNFNEIERTENTSESPKKKKGVSFSLDEFEEGGMQLSGSYEGSVFEHGESQYLQKSQGIVLTPDLRANSHSLNAVNLHLSQNNAKKPLSSQDNISDSSGDVTNSDSGRGGSDLDLTQSNRAEDFKMPNHNSPRHRSHDYPPIIKHNTDKSNPLKSLYIDCNQPIKIRASNLQPNDVTEHQNLSFSGVNESRNKGDDWFPSYV